MYLNFKKKDDILIVELVGELDHHYADSVRTKIDDRIDRDNIRKVILDFNGISFMDSSGIGVVVGRYKKIQCKDGKLCIVNIRENINRVFELSGLFKVIDNYKNLDEAIKSV